MNSLELSEYELADYFIFRLTSETSYKDTSSRKNYSSLELQSLSFCILELKKRTLTCSKCNRKVSVLQAWWHNKLPDSYIYLQEKFKLLLCLNCAKEENNQNIVKIKSNSEYGTHSKEKPNEENKTSNENSELLELYELQNEQIEYYQIYRNKDLAAQGSWPFKC